MTTYTVRWLDTTRPDPIQTYTAETLDEIRGFVKSMNARRWQMRDHLPPMEWLGLTTTTYQHYGQDDAIFMENGL